MNKAERYFIKEFTNGKCAAAVDGFKHEKVPGQQAKERYSEDLFQF